MAKFYNLADQKLFEQYKFLPQEQYRLGLNLPTDPVPDPVVDQGIVNTDAFAGSGGGDGFNPAGNMFGEGVAVNPGDSTVITEGPYSGQSGYYGSVNYSGGLPGNITQKGPGRQFTGDEAMVGDPRNYSKGSFDSLKSPEEKKNFLSRMMNSFRQKTSNLPDWVKTGMTAAQMLNPLTAIPALLNKFGGSGGGPQYGIAGLTDRQKSMYDNLAANNYLYQTDGGMKTYDGKNFSKFDNESIDNYFDSKIDRFGSIEEYEKYLDKDPTQRKNLIKTLEFYKQAKKGDDAYQDLNSNTITNPNITANIINEFATTNNDSGNKKNDTTTTTNSYTPSYTPQEAATTQESYRGGNKASGDGNQGSSNKGSSSKGSSSNKGSTSSGAGGGGGANRGRSRGRDADDRMARGGRAGYFFGGRAGYAEGGPIYSRLGTLSSGVQSAEQQLQGINASLQKAESDLGSESPGGGSSLAGGPSFTSNFEEANNQGPGSNLLYGGSSGSSGNSPLPAPREPGQPEPGPLGLSEIKTMAIGDGSPISSIGGNSSPPSTGGVKTGGAGQTLTGQPLVKQVQSSLMNRAYKSPEYLAWADTVVQTGGYPTEENPGEMGGMMNTKSQPITSAGGGLGGLFGNNSGGGTITDMRDRSNDNRSYEERVRLAQEANDAPTGLMRSDGTRAKVTYKNFMGLDPQTTNLNALPLSGAQPISEERMNSLNRSAIGNGFYDINKGIGSIL
jgi:hypothetical protein